MCNDQRFEIRKISQCEFFIPFFYKVNKCFEETNGKKYLTVAPSNESKQKELWIKIGNLISSITKNSDDYDENQMKIKFDSPVSYL